MLTSYRPVSRFEQGALLATFLAGLLLALLPFQIALLAVAGTAAALLILVQPLFGIALVLLAGPWAALEAIALGNALPLDSGQILFGIAVSGWLAWGIARRRVVLPQTVLNVPFGLYITVGAFSLLGASSFSYGGRELLKWVEVLLIMLMIVDLVTNHRQVRLLPVPRPSENVTSESATGKQPASTTQRALRVVVATVLIAGSSQALIGIWQFGLRGTGPEHFVILEQYYRAYGTFEQPNPFGGFMGLTAALALGILFGLLFQLWPRLSHWLRMQRGPAPDIGRFSWSWLLFVSAAAFLCSLALFLSWSRGAWLGLAAGGAILVLFLPRRRWLGIALLIGAIALFLVGLQLGIVPGSVADRLIGFQDDIRFGDVRGVDINDANYAVIERLAHWQSALDMARERPWLGVGIGNYEPAYAEFALINWPDPLGHAHNYYLNTLAETGILGIVSYLLIWGVVIWQTLWLLRRLSWPDRGIALGLLAAWTALAVHHLLDNLYVNNVHLHLGVMLGILQVLYLVVRNRTAAVPRTKGLTENR